MAASDLIELARRKRRQRDLLGEVSDLTRQLAEAIDRKDEVSVQMVLDQRDAPIQEMYGIEESIREEYLPEMPPAEARRCDELLSGAAAPETPEEKILAEQAAAFRKALEPVVALDKQLSIRVNGRKSFYSIYKSGK